MTVGTRYVVASSAVTYVGKADVGTPPSEAAWQVSRITTEVDGSFAIEFADGDDSYDNVWDNRATLSYS